jgi:hypothetical protein
MKNKHLIKITIPKNLLESLFSSQNYSFPRFLWSEKQKQFETLLFNLPNIIEAVFLNHQDLLLNLIKNLDKPNNIQFHKIFNQIMHEIYNNMITQNIVFNITPRLLISSKLNIFFQRPILNLLYYLQKFVSNIKNRDYLLIRRTIEADIFNSFPNFQHSMLIRKYMEAYLLNNLEKSMHSETDILRNFLLQ